MNALEITDLNKTYSNGNQALKGIDLKIQEGDFFALLGPNGAGKSTTIGILASLVRKTSGKIKIFDYDFDQNLNTVKAFLGFVPQEFNFSMYETCTEIVVNQAGYYGIKRKIAFQRHEKIFKQLDLWNKRNDRSRILSGGFKRRLMIARALIHKPKILILDEPTAGVDVELRRSMWGFLTQLNREGTTIILTTHYLEEAENLCKNIAIIDKGIIVENSSMKSLLSKLHTETFILDLETPSSIPLEIENITSRQVDPLTLEVDLKKNQHLNIVFKYLSGHNIQVRSMRNKANRLEELFIRLLNNKSR